MTTGRASPSPHTQGHLLHPVSAVGAGLARRIPCVNAHQRLALAFELVFKHVHEQAPARIANMLGKTMIAHHIANTQCLDNDRLVLVSQLSRPLMQRVRSCVLQTLVSVRNLDSGFVPVSRAFLLARKLFLLALSVGGAPIEVLKRYIQNQNTPS